MKKDLKPNEPACVFQFPAKRILAHSTDTILKGIRPHGCGAVVQAIYLGFMSCVHRQTPAWSLKSLNPLLLFQNLIY